MAGPDTSQQATIDWRRLAADKNVSIDVARGLWEQAKRQGVIQLRDRTCFAVFSTRPPRIRVPRRSPVNRLKSIRTGPTDPASLGEGKTTLVLLEAQKAGATPKPADATNQSQRTQRTKAPQLKPRMPLPRKMRSPLFYFDRAPTLSSSGVSGLDHRGRCSATATSPAADVYSIGVILAERLLGAFPFRRESYTGLLMAQLQGQHASLPATKLGDVLALAMHPNPNLRPTLDQVLAELSNA